MGTLSGIDTGHLVGLRISTRRRTCREVSACSCTRPVACASYGQPSCILGRRSRLRLRSGTCRRSPRKRCRVLSLRRGQKAVGIGLRSRRLRSGKDVAASVTTRPCSLSGIGTTVASSKTSDVIGLSATLVKPHGTPSPSLSGALERENGPGGPGLVGQGHPLRRGAVLVVVRIGTTSAPGNPSSSPSRRTAIVRVEPRRRRRSQSGKPSASRTRPGPRRAPELVDVVLHARDSRRARAAVKAIDDTTCDRWPAEGTG